jgi:hypothetical protein
MNINNILQTLKFSLVIMSRLPLKAFSSLDELDGPLWLNSLYRDCYEILMLKKSFTTDLPVSLYLNVCDILAMCFDRRGHEAKVKSTSEEQNIWNAINELLIEIELVSVLKFYSSPTSYDISF